MRVGVRSPLSFSIVCTLAALLGACGGGGDSTTPAPPAPVQQGLTTTLAYSTGGEVAVIDRSSPIYGAKVVISPNTLSEPNEDIRITYEDSLPGHFNPTAVMLGAMQASKTLVITRAGKLTLSAAAEVTVPYDKTVVADDEVPVVLYWDEGKERYSAVAVIAIDRSAGTITFLTAHFSKFVVVLLKGIAKEADFISPPSADTGFNPLVDGFFIENFGAYDWPNGSCFGMATYSSWYFANKKSIKGAGLYSLYREGNRDLQQDDQIARELVSRAYLQSSQATATVRRIYSWVQRDAWIGNTALQLLIATKEPQVLLLKAVGSRHAVTLIKYDATKEIFEFYDNNYPGETGSIAWTKQSGFGTYVKNGRTFKPFAVDSASSFFTPTADFEVLFQDAESGWPSSKFPKIVISQPSTSPESPVLYESSGDTNVVVAGNVPRVSGDVSAIRYAHIFYPGKAVAETIVQVGLSGDFSFSLAKLPDAAGTEVFILISQNDGTARCQSDKNWRCGFAAFKNIKIKVINTYAVGGTVSGLLGSGLVLRNSGGDEITISASGSFRFANGVTNGGAYNVTVLTQPSNPNQDCRVTNGSGTVGSSDISNVTVLCSAATAPVIVSSPQSTAVPVGTSATFNVIATGGALNFEWRKGIPQSSVAAPGTTNSSTYVIPVTTLANNGSTYFVIVRNTAGAVTSDLAALTVTTPSQFTSTRIAAGTTHTCGVTTAGGVKCWGNALHGKLGDGTFANSLSPVNVVGLASGGAAVSVGWGHSCALTSAGGVKCWGNNFNGQLGNGASGSLSNSATPVNVIGLSSGVAAITVGSTFTCALTTSGGVKCWGANSEGELGNGSAGDRSPTPVDVAGLTTGVSAISSTDFHTCALMAVSGVVKCWGYDSSGELGNGATVTARTPIDVPILPGGVAAAIAVARGHTCVLTRTDGVKCWGHNANGQLGNGSIADSTTPGDAIGLVSGVASVSANQFHTCALMSAGGAKCWGYNAFGELGNDTTVESLTPVNVSGLVTDVGAVISVGNYHTCTLTLAGVAKCWGSNSNGQLGDGTTTNFRTAPVDVVGF